jgi:hypothetical protein
MHAACKADNDPPTNVKLRTAKTSSRDAPSILTDGKISSTPPPSPSSSYPRRDLRYSRVGHHMQRPYGIETKRLGEKNRGTIDFRLK